MKEAEFTREIERRLRENREVLSGSLVPRWLQPLAAYLGFHPVRVLAAAALAITLVQFAFFYELTMEMSRRLFLYG